MDEAKADYEKGPESPLNMTEASEYETLGNAVAMALGEEKVPGCTIQFHQVTIQGQRSLASGINKLPTLWNSMAGCFHTPETESFDVLKDLSGAFEAGTMTLVLGPPQCGKSSFLKYLAGAYHPPANTKMSGTVRYNGQLQEALKARLPSLVTYVNQIDEHFPSLSVRETLEFAKLCTAGKLLPKWIVEELQQGTMQRNEDALGIIEKAHARRTEQVINVLGLTQCAETQVGNQQMRGVSGGERKRVTTGEMSLGFTYAMFMDEISTGLGTILYTLATLFLC